MHNLDQFPAPNPEVVSQYVAGEGSQTEVVLVLPAQGQVKVLNAVGARIWQLANGRRSVRQIAALISQEYTADVAQAEADTLEFFGALTGRGLVRLWDHPVPDPRSS